MHIYIQHSFRMHRTMLQHFRQRFFDPIFLRGGFHLFSYLNLVLCMCVCVSMCNSGVFMIHCLCIFGWYKCRNDQSRRFCNGQACVKQLFFSIIHIILTYYYYYCWLKPLASESKQYWNERTFCTKSFDFARNMG